MAASGSEMPNVMCREASKFSVEVDKLVSKCGFTVGNVETY